MSEKFKWLCTVESRPSTRIYVNDKKDKVKTKIMWKNRVATNEQLLICLL